MPDLHTLHQPFATSPATSRAPARLRKAGRLVGHTLVLRNAESADAAFIHALRLAPRNAEHLSATAPELAAQQRWLQAYAADTTQAYFVIESRAGQRLGTVRLYDAQGSSFCWGSWILDDTAAPTAAMESALMIYHYALHHLGFEHSHFQVRRGNASVSRFHEKFFGALRVAEDEIEIHYTAAGPVLRQALRRWSRFLPHGLTVEPLS